MKVWPLNKTVREDTASEERDLKKAGLKKVRVPQIGEAGSFWENRGDRYHCGVDLYAPEIRRSFLLKEELSQKQV